MEKYELFLKELSELCRKHDIEISVDTHSVQLSLLCASEWKKQFPLDTSIIDNDYKIIDNEMKNFGLLHLNGIA